MPTNNTSAGRCGSPRARVWSKAALLAAGLAYHGLYYGHLVRAYVQNVRLSHPTTFVSAASMVRLIFSVRGYTAVFVPRLAALHRLCKRIDELAVPGDVVECGVYNGGSAALIASLTCRQSRRAIWLFDSFEGLPQPTDEDGAKARSCVWWCHGDLSKVKQIFCKLGVPESQVHIVKGWFHDTFPFADIQDIALLHVDADWYESVRLCLDTFYDRVQPGGFIVIDDYGHWEGCRRATDEFLAKRQIDTELTRVDYTGRYFQKPPVAQTTRITARTG